MSVHGVTLDGMEVSAETRAKVPGENLRVPRAEFGVLWSLAEHLGSQPPGPHNEYVLGVLRTCRWLANQPVWSRVAGRAQIPTAPLTRRPHAAMPETIDEEYLAAVTARPFERERGRGVAATLEWTWHGSRRPPLDISHAAAG